MAELIVPGEERYRGAEDSRVSDLGTFNPEFYGSHFGWNDAFKAALWIGAPYLAGSGAFAGLGAGAGGAGAAGAGAGAGAAGGGAGAAGAAAGAGAAGAGAAAAGAGAAGAATAATAGTAAAAGGGLMSNPLLWGGISALGSAYTADQQSGVYEEMAKGKLYDPQTTQYLAALQQDAMNAWNAGQFQFGVDPSIYNAYLDYGGNLGIDTSSFQQFDPAAVGYGPEAYAWMQNYLQGGQTAQPNPAALANVQNPWVAGLMGGLGGYASAGGFDPGPAAQTQGSIYNIPGYQPPYYSWTGQPDFQYSGGSTIDPNNIIYTAVPS